MKSLSVAAVAASILAIASSSARALELGSIDFESGNLAAAGSAGDGWKLWDAGAPGENLATIGSTGRTFSTGTSGNDEALFIKPATAGVSNNDLVGAEFVTSTPINFSATDHIYLVTESFADMSAFSDQFIKIDVRWGTAGDGTAYGGFDGSIGGSTFNVNDNYNTEPTNANRQARIATRNPTAAGSDVKYIGDDVTDGPGDVDNNPGNPATNFLDRTYINKTVYRPDSFSVNAEIQGNGYDGSTVVSTYNREARETSDLASAIMELDPYVTTSFDRVSVHLRRHVGAYDGLFVGNVDELNNGFAGHTGLSSPFAPDGTGLIPNPTDIKFGIKSIRIGVATQGDLDLDDDVDTADVTKVVQNFTGDGGSTTQTWFDGDADNDLDVDTVDVTTTVTNFTGAAGGGGGSPSGGPQLFYNQSNGEVRIDANGANIVSFFLQSGGAFLPPANFGDLDSDVGFASALVDNTADQIGWVSALITADMGFDGPGLANLGAILPTGLSLADVRSLISNNGYAQAGGGGGQFLFVPEPGSLWLLLVGLGLAAAIRRRVA